MRYAALFLAFLPVSVMAEAAQPLEAVYSLKGEELWIETALEDPIDEVGAFGFIFAPEEPVAGPASSWRLHLMGKRLFPLKNGRRYNGPGIFYRFENNRLTVRMSRALFGDVRKVRTVTYTSRRRPPKDRSVWGVLDV
jgi:hypothetical protein